MHLPCSLVRPLTVPDALGQASSNPLYVTERPARFTGAQTPGHLLTAGTEARVPDPGGGTRGVGQVLVRTDTAGASLSASEGRACTVRC